MSASAIWAGFPLLSLLLLQGAILGEARKKFRDDLHVPFPPARPNAQNLDAICAGGPSRPRYTNRVPPNSGLSHYQRRGDAVNMVESWYSVCCGGLAGLRYDQILCCAQQAWKTAMSKFCTEEFATLTAVFECCHDDDEERWKCFDADVPNPMYNATDDYTAPRLPLEEGFIFKATNC